MPNNLNEYTKRIFTSFSVFIASTYLYNYLCSNTPCEVLHSITDSIEWLVAYDHFVSKFFCTLRGSLATCIGNSI